MPACVSVFIFLLCFLVTSARVAHLECPQVQQTSVSKTGLDLSHFKLEGEQRLLDICCTCKTVVNRVKRSLPKDNSETQEEVKNKLTKVCKQIQQKSSCKKFVRMKLDVLVEEMSTTDNPETICINVEACQSKSTVEDLVWDTVETLRHRNTF